MVGLPLENLGKVSYLHSIVSLAVSCIISEIARYWSKIAIFFIPLAFVYAPLGGPRWTIAISFGTAKTRVVWLIDGEKFDNTLSRFDKIPSINVFKSRLIYIRDNLMGFFMD